eukprot:4564519-Pyramimonas_sp.AAC.1
MKPSFLSSSASSSFCVLWLPPSSSFTSSSAPWVRSSFSAFITFLLPCVREERAPLYVLERDRCYAIRCNAMGSFANVLLRCVKRRFNAIVGDLHQLSNATPCNAMLSNSQPRHRCNDMRFTLCDVAGHGVAKH